MIPRHPLQDRRYHYLSLASVGKVYSSSDGIDQELPRILEEEQRPQDNDNERQSSNTLMSKSFFTLNLVTCCIVLMVAAAPSLFPSSSSSLPFYTIAQSRRLNESFKRRKEEWLKSFSSHWMQQFVTAASSSFFLLGIDDNNENVPQKMLAHHSVLYDDGTLFIPDGGELCEYFVHFRRRHVEIKRLHLYFQDCRDSINLGERVIRYFEAHLLSNTAQIPFTMTCGGNNDDDDDYIPKHSFLRRTTTTATTSDRNAPSSSSSILSMLSMINQKQTGPIPIDSQGNTWSPETVCECLSCGLDLISDTIIRRTMQNIVDRAVELQEQHDIDDDDIHLDDNDLLPQDDVVVHVDFRAPIMSSSSSPTHTTTNGAKSHETETTTNNVGGFLRHQVYVDAVNELLQQELGQKENPDNDSSPSDQDDSERDVMPLRISLVREVVSDVKCRDEMYANRTQTFENDLVRHFKIKFPEAEIIVRHSNPLQIYASLMRSKMGAICGTSLFCVLPVLATTHRGRLLLGQSQNTVTNHDILSLDKIKGMNQTDILKWMRNEI